MWKDEEIIDSVLARDYDEQSQEGATYTYILPKAIQITHI